MTKKLIKKILKTIASNIIWYKWRITILRWCGFIIGEQVYIADGLIIVEELNDSGNVVIGDRVSIAPRVTIITSSHPNNSRIRTFVPTPRGKVVIESDAWIGAGVIIMPNITIGEGAVVGAGSVVTRNVAPYQIVAGIPAKIIGAVKIPDSE